MRPKLFFLGLLLRILWLLVYNTFLELQSIELFGPHSDVTLLYSPAVALYYGVLLAPIVETIIFVFMFYVVLKGITWIKSVQSFRLPAIFAAVVVGVIAGIFHHGAAKVSAGGAFIIYLSIFSLYIEDAPTDTSRINAGAFFMIAIHMLNNFAAFLQTFVLA